MNKRFISIIAAIVIGVGGFLWLTKPKAADISSSAQASNHTRGTSPKGIVLIEYGDYQCPACAQYYPLVKSLAETYKDRVLFQFRNYPLESLHQNARAGARAAEAANIQGKFWEMHDALYENQSTWQGSGDPLTLYKAYAQQVGVADLNKFETDYKSAAVNDIINADIKEGQKFSITGTPTFILDGKKIDNPRDQASFNKILEDAIASKK